MSKGNPMVNVRVPPEFKAQLEAMAKQDHTAVADIAREALAAKIAKASGGGRMGEVGVQGLAYSNGVVLEEFDRNLIGDRALQVYREMIANSPVIQGVLYAIDMLMRQASWEVTPGGDSSEDEQAAEFVEECRNDMSVSWEDTLSEIMSFVAYGWSYHEIVYKVRNGGNPLTPGHTSQYTDQRIGWRKWPIRAQSTRWEWKFGPDGSIEGMVQNAMNDAQRTPVFIPIQKSLLFRSKPYKGNPEPPGILRGAYIPWWYAKRIMEIEAVGIERDLVGFPVAKIPAVDIQNETDAFKNWTKTMRNLRRNQQEALVVPSDMDENGNPYYSVELLTTGGRRQFDINPIVERYERRAAMVAMADFLFLGHEKVGSFALASSKTSMFAMALGAWLDQIASVVNRHAIPRLMALNGFNLEAMPRMQHGDIEIPDPVEIAEAVSKFTGSGMPFWGGPDGLSLENWGRRLVGAPELADAQYEERLQQEEQDQQAEQEQQMAMMEYQANLKAAGRGQPPQANQAAPNVRQRPDGPAA